MLKTREEKRIVEKCFAFFPLVATYIILLYLSMDTAPDRDNYLFMMEHPFVGREEIGIHIYSYVTGFFGLGALSKLLILQIIAFSLWIYSFSISFQNQRFQKTLLCLAAIIALRSNGLGVQLRIGFASVLFFLVVILIHRDEKSHGFSRKILLLFLPAIFHYGTIPPVLCFLLFYFARNKSRKLKAIITLMFFVVTQLAMNLLPMLLSYMKYGDYYMTYLGAEDETTRFIPYSFVFYVLLLLIYLIQVRETESLFPYFLIAGLALPLLRYTNDFVLGLKMLSGFEPVLLWRYVDKIAFNSDRAVYLSPVLYLCCFASFFYFAYQVGLL